MATVDERVAEIPSPTDDLAERGAWLSRAMAGTWADLGPQYQAWRDRLVAALERLSTDTVVVSHFIAINAVVGRAVDDDRVMHVPLGNCSITTVDTAPGHLAVVELGASATTEVLVVRGGGHDEPVSARWTHTGYAQQIVFGEGAARAGGRGAQGGRASGGCCWSPPPAGRPPTTAPGWSRPWAGPLASTFAEVTSHAPTPMVQRAVMQARRDGVDGIVSFGGGSAADTGKAVCFFTEQEQGTPGTSFADRPVLPHVSITTTYSGAELTPFFGMTDPATHQKSGAGGPTIAPDRRRLRPHPDAARRPPGSAPRPGMNALAHCVEVVWSPYRTPEAEAIALAGAARIVDALPAVVDDPDDLDARTEMFQGAILAGRCLQNASMGVHHGLAQLVGGRTGIPHGLANAIVLPAAMAYNAAGRPRRAGQAGPGPRGRRRHGGGDRAGRPARPAHPPVRGRRQRGRPRGGGPAVAEQRQRAGQPPPGVRGRRPRHPPHRLLTHPPSTFPSVSAPIPRAERGRSGERSPDQPVGRRRSSGASWRTRQNSLPSGSAHHAHGHAVLLDVADDRAAEPFDLGGGCIEIGHLDVHVDPVLGLLGLGDLLEGEGRTTFGGRR